MTTTFRLSIQSLAARGETPAAFGRRCIPADCVAPPSNIPDIAPHRAQDARWGPRSAVVAPLRRGPHGADCAPWGGTSGRLAALGATLDFHHGLLTLLAVVFLSMAVVAVACSRAEKGTNGASATARAGATAGEKYPE